MSNFADELLNQQKEKEQAKAKSLAAEGIADLLGQESNKDSLETLKLNVKKSTIGNLPRTPEEVHKYVKVVYGYEIPWTNCTPEMNAPFEWFYDVATGRVPTSVAQGGRGTAKTLGGSIMHHMWNSCIPGIETHHVASTKPQAAVAQNYLYTWNKDPLLGALLEKGMLKESARWLNGSYWKIITGSMSGVSGQHPTALTLDELEFWDTPALEQTWAVPVNRTPYLPGIWAGFSTMQRSYGAMAYLVDAIENGEKPDIKLYKWSVFESMKRCVTCVAIDENPHGSDEARAKSCNLWEDCKGLRGTKSTGWIARKDVCKLKANMTLESWQTQGLCLKPSSSGLVLHNFTHEYKPRGNYSKWEFNRDNPVWYAAIDPAEGKKCVIYFIQLDQFGRRYVFDEINIEQCADASQAKLAFYDRCVDMQYGDPEVIVFDPRRSDAMATFARGAKFGTGLNKSYNVDRPDMSEDKGGQEIVVTIEFLRTAICNGAGEMSLFVNPVKCPKLVRAVKEHHYKTKKNSTEIIGSQPAEAYKDEIDPLRYFEQWFKYKFSTGQASIRMI